MDQNVASQSDSHKMGIRYEPFQQRSLFVKSSPDVLTYYMPKDLLAKLFCDGHVIFLSDIQIISTWG